MKMRSSSHGVEVLDVLCNPLIVEFGRFAFFADVELEPAKGRLANGFLRNPDLLGNDVDGVVRSQGVTLISHDGSSVMSKCITAHDYTVLATMKVGARMGNNRHSRRQAQGTFLEGCGGRVCQAS